MLITTIEELRCLLPTNKWTQSEMKFLLPMIEEEEENVLVPVLGRRLFNRLTDDYEKTVSDNPGAFAEPGKRGDTTTRILKVCQRIILYRMMANNSGIFSVSFNIGGGFNVMSQDNYEQPDKETMKRFERDAWNKSLRNVENLLILLEEDAQNEQTYTALWKESAYFFRHSTLLFTTAAELNRFLPLPAAEMRSRYIALVPAIDLCQDTYVTPRIGQDIMDILLKRKFTAKNTAAAEEEHNNTKLYTIDGKFIWANEKLLAEKDRQDITEEDIDEELAPLIRQLDLHVRRALANYVASESKELRQEKSILHADMQIATAEKIANHIRIEKMKKEGTADDSKPAETEKTSPQTTRRTYDPYNPDNAVLDLGGLWHA